jgi:hypothetical protein
MKPDPEAFGFTLPLPTPKAINGFQDISLAMMRPTTDDEIQRMTLTFHHQVALDAPQTVLYWYHDSRS